MAYGWGGECEFRSPCSHLAMRGIPIGALQELLAHKTLAIIQRYSHLAPEPLQNAVKLLDGVIRVRSGLVGADR